MAGRLTFVLFVGFMSFSLGLFGKIAMAILYVVYAFHIYVYLKFPKLVSAFF